MSVEEIKRHVAEYAKEHHPEWVCASVAIDVAPGVPHEILVVMPVERQPDPPNLTTGD